MRRRGNLNNGANYGPRYVNANNAPSNANWNYGAALIPTSHNPSGLSHILVRCFSGVSAEIKIPSDWIGLVDHESKAAALPAPEYGSRRDEKSMRRVANIWDSFCSVETAVEAIYRGTENKRSDRVVVRIFGYPRHPDRAGQLDPAKVHHYADRLVAELSEGRWRHLPGKKRHIVSNGKSRDIEIARLRDHIVQWMAMLAVEKHLTARMYRYCVGNMPRRGIEDARRNVERWARSGDCKYFVKLDIRHFYQTVKLDKLSAMMHDTIKDRRFMAVMDQIIYSSAEPGAEVPAGLAIGYYSSPWLANFYLGPLDRYITDQLVKTRRGKRIRIVKHYLRYVDDLLLQGNSKTDLKRAVKKIMQFAGRELGLEVKACWEICEVGELLPPDGSGRMKLKPGTKRIDIVGYCFTRTNTTVRARNFLRVRRLLRLIVRRLTRERRMTLRSAQAAVSRLGWFSHADSRFFLQKYVQPFIDVGFMKEVISYASKNGIVREAAGVYCRPVNGKGGYHILHERGAAAA